jgi:hypothetical protein
MELGTAEEAVLNEIPANSAEIKAMAVGCFPKNDTPAIDESAGCSTLKLI